MSGSDVIRREPEKPAVVVISSHVVRGSVGNRSAVFALERLGFPVWSVPTVTLPYHPGHGRATRIVPDEAAFVSLLEDLLRSPWIGEIAAVLTGYMASSRQIGTVSGFISRLKENSRQLVYLCDPIIGDVNGLYVAKEVAVAMRDLLLPLADITTPNLAELAWLAGEKIPEDAAGAAMLARELGPQTVVVTSAPPLLRGNIGNLLAGPEIALQAEHRRLDGPPNGSGDLFAALLLAHLLDGLGQERALQRATASVFEVFARAARRNSTELMPERDADALARPTAVVALRQIGFAPRLAGR